MSFCLVFVCVGCGKEKAEEGVQNSGSSGSIATESLNLDEMFTDRDKEIGYDEDAAAKITFNNDEIICESGNVSISDCVATIKREGTYILCGNLTDGQLIIDVADTEKVQLVLDNADITCKNSAAIYIKEADKVFITLGKNSENTLISDGEFVNIDDNNIDGVIFSKADLTLNGEGALNIKTENGHGIVSKDDLAVTSGSINITASSHALSGKDSVRIAGGSLTLISGKDGIHAENSDDATLGFVYIENGTFEIDSEDDGITAAAQLVIAGGDINIKNSSEGLAGMTIDISGGNINIVSRDDGINAASGNTNGMMGDSSTYINISGGKIYVNASGDGIDSNGNLYVSGGETYVSGPVNSGNGALDYAIEGKITGGIFVATGASGMAQNFSDSSTQCSMLVSVQNMIQGEIVLKNSSNEELVTFTPETAYNSVVISTPDIKTGETYMVLMADEETSVKMEGIIYGEGMNGFNNNRGGGGGNRHQQDRGEKSTDMMGIPGNMGERPSDMSEPPEEMEFPENMEERPRDMSEFPEGI